MRWSGSMAKPITINPKDSCYERRATGGQVIRHDVGGSWWVVRDSNSRHSRCKRDALPTELTTPRHLIDGASLAGKGPGENPAARPGGRPKTCRPWTGPGWLASWSADSAMPRFPRRGRRQDLRAFRLSAVGSAGRTVPRISSGSGGSCSTARLPLRLPCCRARRSRMRSRWLAPRASLMRQERREWPTPSGDLVSYVAPSALLAPGGSSKKLCRKTPRHAFRASFAVASTASRSPKALTGTKPVQVRNVRVCVEYRDGSS